VEVAVATMPDCVPDEPRSADQANPAAVPNVSLTTRPTTPARLYISTEILSFLTALDCLGWERRCANRQPTEKSKQRKINAQTMRYLASKLTPLDLELAQWA